MSLLDRLLAVSFLLAAGCTAETSSGPPAAVTQSAETAKEPESRSFDRGAAVTALKAVDIHPCVAPGSDGATGHVVVTFGPDGQAASAVVDEGAAAGTAAGACVAAAFRRAAVPSFRGDPVRVGYSFVLR